MRGYGRRGKSTTGPATLALLTRIDVWIEREGLGVHLVVSLQSRDARQTRVAIERTSPALRRLRASSGERFF